MTGRLPLTCTLHRVSSSPGTRNRTITAQVHAGTASTGIAKNSRKDQKRNGMQTPPGSDLTFSARVTCEHGHHRRWWRGRDVESEQSPRIVLDHHRDVSSRDTETFKSGNETACQVRDSRPSPLAPGRSGFRILSSMIWNFGFRAQGSTRTCTRGDRKHFSWCRRVNDSIRFKFYLCILRNPPCESRIFPAKPASTALCTLDVSFSATSLATLVNTKTFSLQSPPCLPRDVASFVESNFFPGNASMAVCAQTLRQCVVDLW
jgi:hypothetical protein